MAAGLLIVVILPLLRICDSAIHLRLKLSEQASMLMHHISHGTANATVREALRSLSKEQQYGGDLLAKQAHLTRSLLPEGCAEGEECKAGDAAEAPAVGAEQTAASKDPALFKSLAASAPTEPVQMAPSAETGTSASGSSKSGSGSGSPSQSADNAVSEAESEGVKKETWWSLMTSHNFNLGFVRVLAQCRMVEVSYIPTRPEDEQMLQCASDSLAFYQN